MSYMRTIFCFKLLFAVAIVLVISRINSDVMLKFKARVRQVLATKVSDLTHGPSSNPGYHSQHNGTSCDWICPHGLQAAENLYVLQSDEALDVAVQQFNDLLQCVARGQHNDYQELQTYLSKCPSHVVPVDETQKQSVKRAIGRKAFAKNQYFEITRLEPGILSIALSWKSLNKSNWQTGPLLVDKYYPLRNINQLCTAKTKCDTGTTNASECESQFISALPSQCQDNLHVLEHPKASQDDMNKEDLEDYPLYVHIIKGGTVNSEGNVRVGHTEVIPSQCRVKQVELSSATSQTLTEVFVISQFWGGGYYHAPIEDFPRLTPYLSFLKRYPEIKIHAGAKFLRHYMPVVGLDPDRLVFGQVKADVIYLPQGGGCGWLHPISGQLLHEQYAHYIQQRLSRSSPDSDTPLKTAPDDVIHSSTCASSILLIQRKSKRWLAQHEEVKYFLTQIAPKYNLTVEIYSDKKLPSFNGTMDMFSRAKLVVAPHGAGLSNTMFSRTGTRVIEILCNPKPVLCYQKLSTTLGQPYIGLLSLKKSKSNYACGGLTVDITYLKLVVQYFLEN